MNKTVSKQISNPVEPAKRPRKAGDKPKIEQVVALLRRPKGAALAELMAATGWQAHTVRGAISGAVKTKRGLNVVTETTAAGRVYRIVELAQ